jgi:CheY-like chemotaxis protein
VAEVRDLMERQLEHLVRLVDDLLDVSRIGQGKLHLALERLSMADVVAHALEMSRGLIEQQDDSVTVTLPDEPIFVEADRTRLCQALCNLLNNAAKYSDPGSRIWLTVSRDRNEAVVSVKDSGIGIPAGMLPTIFQLFVQVDRSLEKSQGGLGVGLAIVKRLVEMHGGTVEARSEGPGAGSEFVVRLPAVQPSPGAEAKEGAAPSEPLAHRRILIVDDNVDAAASLAMILRIVGNEVRIAHDGEEGFNAALVFRPDVILLDIGMPRLNGFDTARRIRQEPWGRNVSLLALTGWGHDEDRRKSQDAGFDHHLVKPVEPEALLRLLGELPARTI